MVVTRAAKHLFERSNVKDCFIHLCKSSEKIPGLSEEQKALLGIPSKPEREFGRREVGKKIKKQKQTMPGKIMKRRSTIAVARHVWQPDDIGESTEPNNEIVNIGDGMTHESNVEIETYANIQDDNGTANNEIVDTAPSPINSTSEYVQEVIDSILHEAVFEATRAGENVGKGTVAMPSSSNQEFERMEELKSADAEILSPIIKVEGSSGRSKNKNRRVSFAEESTVHEYSDIDETSSTSEHNKENVKSVRPFDSVTLQGPDKVPVEEFAAVQRNYLARILGNNFEFEN